MKRSWLRWMVAGLVMAAVHQPSWGEDDTVWKKAGKKTAAKSTAAAASAEPSVAPPLPRALDKEVMQLSKPVSAAPAATARTTDTSIPEAGRRVTLGRPKISTPTPEIQQVVFKAPPLPPPAPVEPVAPAPAAKVELDSNSNSLPVAEAGLIITRTPVSSPSEGVDQACHCSSSPSTVSTPFGAEVGSTCEASCCAPFGGCCNGMPCCEGWGCCDDGCYPGCFWFRLEALAWWTEGLDLPAIEGNGVTVFTGGDINDDTSPGARVTVGWWIDCWQSCGIEASVFALGEQAESLTALGDGTAGFLNVSRDFFGGGVLIRNNLCGEGCYRCDVLTGYRFIGLNEEVKVLTTNGGTTVDRFRTENHFHGIDVGFATQFHKCRWSLELLSKVAIGGSHERVEITGVDGLLTSPLNTGNRSTTRFAVAPEFGANIGYQVCDCLRLHAGYSLIYLSDAVRPDSYVGVANFPGFKSSGFVAHGASLGLEFHF